MNKPIFENKNEAKEFFSDILPGGTVGIHEVETFTQWAEEKGYIKSPLEQAKEDFYSSNKKIYANQTVIYVAELEKEIKRLKGDV